MKKTLHLIAHTHWDREWYKTFQQFRWQLVHLVDHLLRIFDTDPNFTHFMLDGQTIILEDYLAIRPENSDRLRTLIKQGRLLIGPWYILADEFLVSPEAIIRNLLEGKKICQQFGSRMEIGYIPDPFGHIAQMPQILVGFGIESACFWRGLADEPCEVIWQAADGSEVLSAYLRESYSNAASLPMDDDRAFTDEVHRLGSTLEQQSAVKDLLLFYGTDHAEPSPRISASGSYANDHLNDFRSKISTLPDYFLAIRKEIGKTKLGLPRVYGELRGSKRVPLLPGVLSSRMWIKQRNETCQTLLESWAEPFSAWASWISSVDPLTSPFQADTGDFLHHAWRLLMQNHPHDSICGCSIDQVHIEMGPRFDQVEQIAEMVITQSLTQIAGQTDNKPHEGFKDICGVIQVFNPMEGPRTDRSAVEIQLPNHGNRFEIVDADGQPTRFESVGIGSQELINAVMDRETFLSSFGMVHEGRAAGMVFRSFQIVPEGNRVRIHAIFSLDGEPDLAAWNAGTEQIKQFLADPAITDYFVYATTPPATRVIFEAMQVPGFGYSTYWVRSLPELSSEPKKIELPPLVKVLMPILSKTASKVNMQQLVDLFSTTSKNQARYRIENELFLVELNRQTQQISVVEKRSGLEYHDLNQFYDGGDCGDEYNYCPPVEDRLFRARIHSASIHDGSVERNLILNYSLIIPRRLASDRKRRSSEKVILRITTTVRLVAGVSRVEFSTQIDNPAEDHRLRVHFPVPFLVNSAEHDMHFQILERSVGIPKFDSSWSEEPRPEVPQRRFTAVTDGKRGLMLSAKGLPEVEVAKMDSGSEIRLTLLRCVGWLSRDDLKTRSGHAGPGLETPGAQEPGRHVFEYALIPFHGPVDTAASQAYAFHTPLRAVTTGLHSGILSHSASLIDTLGNLTITCIKLSENGKGMIVRGWNHGAPQKVGIRFNQGHHRCQRVRLDELPLQELQPDANGYYMIECRPWEIFTLCFEQ